MRESCVCGKADKTSVKKVISEPRAIEKISEIVENWGATKPFVIADVNTYKAAGEKVVRILDKHGISYSKYVFDNGEIEPDEKSVGSAVMHYDTKCDLIIAVGPGVINDIGKFRK